MTRLRRLVLFYFTTLIAVGQPAFGSGSLSGTYLTKFPNAVLMIYLFETEPGIVSGHWTGSVIGPNGKELYTGANIAGSFYGTGLTLQLLSDTKSKPKLILSGSFRDGTINLTGLSDGTVRTYSFSRSTNSDFEEAVTRLKQSDVWVNPKNPTGLSISENSSGDMTSSNDTISNLSKSVDDLTAGMSQYKNMLPQIINTSENLINQMDSVTSRMNDLLSREEALYNVQEATGTRMQIFLQINQTTLETPKLEYAIHDLMSRVLANQNQLNAVEKKDQVACSTLDQSLISSSASANEGEAKSECDKLALFVAAYKDTENAIQSTMRELQAKFETETRQQKIISARANDLLRDYSWRP